jgi:hypothetical protein
MTERRKTAFGLLALAAVAFAFYLPVLSGRVAYADDLAYFFIDPTSHAYVSALNLCGRPLTGQYLRLCHRIIAETRSPDLAHLPGLLGALLLGLATFAWLRRLRVRAAPAFLLCVCLLALPSALLCGCYLNTGSYGWAALAGAAAALVFAPSGPGRGRVVGALATAAAWLLLVLGMFTYQPTALFFWTLTAASLACAPCPDWRTFRQRALPLFALGLAAMAGYAVAYKIFFRVMGLEEPARAALTFDVSGKLAWFSGVPLRIALSLWVLPAHNAGLALGTFLLALAGPVVDLLGLLGWKEKGGLSDHAAGQGKASQAALIVVKWATLYALLPISYAFNMIVQESYPAYRTMLAPAATMLVLLFASTARLASLLGRRWGRWALVVVLTATTVAALYLGGTNLSRLAILPRVGELEYIKTCLLSYDPARHRSVHVIMPQPWEGLASTAVYEEFGLPSTVLDWGPTAMVRRAAAEVMLPPPPVSQSRSPSEPPPEGAFVIDMRWMALLNPYRPR